MATEDSDRAQPADSGGADAVLAGFREAGVADPDGAARICRELRSRLNPQSPFLVHWDESLQDICQTADPELALSTWTRWVEDDLEEEGPLNSGSGAPGDPSSPGRTRASTWTTSSEFRKGFLRLAGMSPALGNLLLTLWMEFRPHAWQSGWETRESLARRLGEGGASLSEKEFLEFVRQFQRVESLRIAYLDCMRNMSVDQVTLQISLIADALVDACYSRALETVSRRQGKVPPARGFVVFALGKLGGLELNYSSDIDLNFIYDESLPHLETLDGRQIDDPHEIERFFTLVAQRLVHFVTAFTESGQLYRLDTRLRPGGSSGRLVWSARAAIDYYYSMGRAWERQALIRMRPAAGDTALAERLLKELEPYIFPSSLSADDVAEIRGLKLQMEKMARDKGFYDSELKIGRGGIRDVEYIVQYLQLVHASRIPALRTANVFRALEALDGAGLLKPEETDVLRRGYRFLRKVEHRIQMTHLRRTHRLPEDPAELHRLARGLGFSGCGSFRGHLGAHSARIRKVYGLLFEEATSGRPETQELPALLELPREVSAAEGARLLIPFGFSEPDRAFQRLYALASPAENRIVLDSHKGKEVFADLLPKLLRELSLQPEPDRTLSNFEECVQTLGARSVFYQLLDEDPKILRLFVEICARSSLIVETLRAHPDIFDELVDCLLTGYSLSRETLLSTAEKIPVEGVDRDSELFKFKHLHMLLIAIRDLTRMDNLSGSLLHIASLSEALLRLALRKSLEEARKKMGEWEDEPPRFLLLGLGKLGGLEMSYKSDLDLVILSSGQATTRKGIQTQEYFERLAQMLLHTCSLADPRGPLLRIDLRLRPLGSHNSLAISMDAWRQYFSSGEARTWERQAFLRARPVAGDEDASQEAMDFIRKELVLGGRAGPQSEVEALTDIWEMRKKIEGHAGSGDLKRGEGGIVDVEFLIQALQLCHGKAHPEILTPNVPAALGALMKAGLIDSGAGSDLLTSYEFLRWVENRVSLMGEAGKPLESLSTAELESLVHKLGYKSTGEESAVSIYHGELAYHRRKNRQHLLRVLGKSQSGREPPQEYKGS